MNSSEKRTIADAVRNYPELVKGIQAKIDGMSIQELEGAGVDRFGTSREYLKRILPAMAFLYYIWHRVEATGAENIPPSGRGLVVANHAGMLPVDGAMTFMAALDHTEPSRLLRCVVDHIGAEVPFVSIFFSRSGQVIGTTENVEYLLEHDELLMIFPEGMKGMKKTWKERYRLERFAHGFVELAIKHKTPIIPAAIVGSEEMKISLWNSNRLARLIGMPFAPITPQAILAGALMAAKLLRPWRKGGPIGLGLSLLTILPPPSKFRIEFGEPIDLSDRPPEILDDPAAIGEIVEEIRGRVQKMVDHGLKKRPAPFL